MNNKEWPILTSTLPLKEFLLMTSRSWCSRYSNSIHSMRAMTAGPRPSPLWLQWWPINRIKTRNSHQNQLPTHSTQRQQQQTSGRQNYSLSDPNIQLQDHGKMYTSIQHRHYQHHGVKNNVFVFYTMPTLHTSEMFETIKTKLKPWSTWSFSWKLTIGWRHGRLLPMVLVWACWLVDGGNGSSGEKRSARIR